MGLPAAVQAQVDQAEALQAQLYPTGQATEESVQPAEEVVEAEVPSNVIEMPKQPEPVQAETPKPVTENAEDAAYWKQRFSTLKGKFDAEVPQLYQQLKEQNSQLQQVMQQLQERESKQETKPDVRDEKDVEEYGADLVDMVSRKAAAIAQAAIAQYDAHLRKEFGVVQDQVGQVAEKVGKSEADTFWGKVMSLVPDWDAVDQDPEWIEFLDTTPEFAEVTYRALAKTAIQKGDAQKVAKLVAIWRGPQVAAPPAPTQRQTSQAELQRQVTPSTTKAGTTAPQGERIWSREEYEQAMDVRNGQRMGQKEADRLEADANRAVAEGRVRW